ncbi:YitT family protein [Hymenobacter sediminicola]|uniref:YitT family protein n=1 Tax=Hymenobacter sediminicola TaxID=2761579 RepID=A0A7G7W8H7_9BACT|nr:YitT family protein [Hymenobacter sediminicola]QNH62670.1 YitT family protein [Hymenobacter sediminicola]
MIFDQPVSPPAQARKLAHQLDLPTSSTGPAPGTLLASSASQLGQKVLQFVLLLAGVFSAALGLKGFLLPNEFIDGGVTGISMLVSHVTGISLSALILLINIPFVILGYYQLGSAFALKTLLTITALAGALMVVSFPALTQDKLLIAVFGGFFLGAGIGLAMRGGGVLDGTEILAVYISRKLPGSIGDIIMIINIIIFGVAAWLLSVETALYSILAYLSAAKTVDFILVGIEEYTSLTIISFHSNEIRQLITDKLHRGATVYECTQGFGSHGHQRLKVEAVFTVVTRLEVISLTKAIHAIDPQAFVVMQSVSDTRGGLIKKRALH